MYAQYRLLELITFEMCIEFSSIHPSVPISFITSKRQKIEKKIK